ncbi:MAG: antibiotic biosynthesis monooxygenase [Terriglobales bacterium]
MFTRFLKCTIKMDKKQEFIEAARTLATAYKGQPGFMDLMTFVSDEHPEQAFVVAVWKTRADADAFYKSNAPLLDLKPYVTRHEIEHYYLETSAVFQVASGRAA